MRQRIGLLAITMWAVMACLTGGTVLAFDFSLKAKIQSELDANPFLKEQKIKLQVVKEEGGYVTIEVSEGLKSIREQISQGADILNPQFESYYDDRHSKNLDAEERKTLNAIRRSVEVVRKLEGIKAIQLTAAVNNQQDRVEELFFRGLEEYEKKNYQQAMPWFQQAADLGLAQAWGMLGDIYLFGRPGVEKNSSKAYEMFTKGVALQDELSSYYLGVRYYFGQGVPVDERKACELFQQGSLGRDNEAVAARASKCLGYCYQYGRGGWPKDEAKAEESYRRAVAVFEEVKSAWAKGDLAKMYWQGRGVPVDLNKARTLYTEAGEEGRYNLAYFLATCANPQFRDCQKAQAITETFLKIKNAPDSPWYYNSLALVFACDGQFDRAILNQEKAILLAVQKKESIKSLARYKKQLTLFQNKQPYLDEGQDD